MRAGFWIVLLTLVVTAGGVALSRRNAGAQANASTHAAARAHETGGMQSRGRVNPLDAALILQLDAGIIHALPAGAAGSLPTETATSTPTATPTVTATATPYGPVSFAIGLDVDRDGTNDCGTGAPASVGDGAPDPVPVQVNATTCNGAAGQVMQANVYLMDTGGVVYAAQDTNLEFAGLVSKGRGDSIWAGCVIEAVAGGTNFESAGCTYGLPPAPPRHDAGLMTKFTLTCTVSGSLRLQKPDTVLIANEGGQYHDPGTDELTVACGTVSTATLTSTPTGTLISAPTETPSVSTPTFTPTTIAPSATPAGLDTATSTPTFGNTPTFTNTPTSTRAPTFTHTPTRTATPTPSTQNGDANCDHRVNSLDALAVLQLSAGVVGSLPCHGAADVNHDGRVNPLDAALILQLDAGIIHALPAGGVGSGIAAAGRAWWTLW